MRICSCLLALALALGALVGPASAQLVNGDFEATPNHLAGWTVSYTQNGRVQPVNSPQPYNISCGFLASTGGPIPNYSGTATIEQTFTCGSTSSETPCVISFTYSIRDAAEFFVEINGTQRFFDAANGGNKPFTTVQLIEPCGVVTLRFTGQNSATHPGPWTVVLDDVTATCEQVVGVEASSFGGVKVRD